MKKLGFITIATVFGVWLFLLPGCKTEEIKPIPADANQQRVMTNETILQIADSSTQFHTFARLINAAGLYDTFNGAGPLTVFAPTDKAFDKLSKGTVDNWLLPENKQHLREILTYHVVSGKLNTSDVMRSNTLTTLNGSMLRINTVGLTVMVDNADLVDSQILASNGIIHPIDTVLIPK